MTTMEPNITLYSLNLIQRHGSVKHLLEEFAPAAPMAEKVVPPLWYFIGFFFNPICMVVWFGQRMRRNNSSAIYLGSLAISDFIFLLLHGLYTLQGAWGYNTYSFPISCEVFHFVYYIPQYFSTFLVLGFTAERYIAVCHPFLKERWCTVQLAIVFSCILLFISVALASPQAYIWTYSEMHGICAVRQDEQEKGDNSFWTIWTWISDIFGFIFIPLLVLIFNILVLKEIFKISRNDVLHGQQNRRGGGNTASTVTLLSVSFYLVVTQVTATVTNNIQNLFPMGNLTLSDEEVRADETWSALFNYIEALKIIEVICLSHYACYFFIYCLTGKHFRKEVFYLISLHGRLSFLKSVSKKRRKERYSMVSSNGNPMSETYATNMSTTM